MEKYSDPQKLEYVTILSQDLLTTFKIILEKNTWLSPKTKKYALYKLSKFKFIIGKPENLREDPDLNYGTNLNDNMKSLIELIKS
jgi:putative endopeptidase